VLTGSRITVAGTLTGERFSGVQIAPYPFLLLTSAVLVVLSATLIVFGMLKKPPDNKKAPV
jgi:hypothetical protein